MSANDQQIVQPQDILSAYNDASQTKPTIDSIVHQIAQQVGVEVTTRMKQPGSAVNSMVVKDKTTDMMNDFNGVNFTGTKDKLHQAMKLFKQNPNIEIVKKAKIKNPATGYTAIHWDFKIKGVDQNYECQFTTPKERALQEKTHRQYKNEEAKISEGKQGDVIVPPETELTAKIIRDNNSNINPLAGLADNIKDQTPKDVFYRLMAPKSTNYGDPKDLTPVTNTKLKSAHETALDLHNWIIEKLSQKTNQGGV